MQSNHHNNTNLPIVIAAFAYLAFVIYGSLVPLTFSPMPLNEAWSSFQSIRHLDLGTGSRADWIANILLFIPLTFFWMAYLSKTSRIFNLGSALIILFLSTLLIFSIEFTQLFFPPRTVSINDLQAEFIGSIIGIIIWFTLHENIEKKALQLFGDRKTALRSFLVFYLTIYFFLSFFPFDFLVNFDELSRKFNSQYISWFIVKDLCLGTSQCIIKTGSEILLLIPVGFLYCSIVNRNQPCKLAALISQGLFFSIMIEAIQFFIASGITQGFSILTRVFGLVLGYKLFRLDQKYTLSNYIVNKKILLFFYLPLYIILIILSRKFSSYSLSHLISFEEKLEALSFIPFYYHYYTSETVAMVSLLSNFLLYFPIGLFYGLWNYHNIITKKAYSTLLTAGAVALIIETSTLLFSNQHADPTNILIAVIASYTGFYIINWIKFFSQKPSNNSKPLLNKKEPKPAETHSGNLKSVPDHITNQIKPGPQKHLIFGQIQHRIMAILGLMVVIISLINFPVAPFLIGLSLIVYAILIWHNNHLWLLVIPAALPVMDLAPLSGHFYWSSFDLLLTTTLVIFLWKGIESTKSAFNNRKITILITLVSLIWLISTINGLTTATSIDANSFVSELSPYNSLRIAKGFFWAILLLPILTATLSNKDKADKLLIRGLAIGLFATALAVIWERLLFSGIFNFSNDFRVTGTFSSMHTGGGHIETYLVLVLPLILNSLRQSFSRNEKVIYLGIISIGLYALLVTYARGGYLAFAISILVLSFSTMAYLFNIRKWRWSPFVAILITLFFFSVLFQSTYVQERFSTIENDFNIRAQHWSNTINMMDDSAITKLFGMGLGQFPRIYSTRNPDNITLGNFKFVSEKNNTFLQLSSGQTMYFEQIINLQPDTTYLLTLDLFSNEEKSRVTVPICEKAMLYSFRCSWRTIYNNDSKGKWVTKVSSFSSKTFQSDSLFPRTIKISLYNPGTIINIDNLSVIDDYGNELIKNGDFEKRMDHWFYSTDNHLPWHTKQLGMQLYFSQGLIGLSLFLALCAITILKAGTATLNGDVMASGLLASIIAFLVTGIFSSSFDAPRLTLLFFMLIFFTLSRTTPDKSV